MTQQWEIPAPLELENVLIPSNNEFNALGGRVFVTSIELWNHFIAVHWVSAVASEPRAGSWLRLLMTDGVKGIQETQSSAASGGAGSPSLATSFFARPADLPSELHLLLTDGPSTPPVPLVTVAVV